MSTPVSSRRRGLGLGLAALAVIGMSACDPMDEGEELEQIADSEGDEPEAPLFDEDAELVDDAEPMASTVVIDAGVYGTDLELVDEVEVNWNGITINLLVIDATTGQELDEIPLNLGSEIEWVGTTGADFLDASALNADLIAKGKNGADTIIGGQGDDYLHGQGGDDTISGGPGDDLLVGGNGEDVINGDDGDDIMFADTITAGPDNVVDHLVGGDGTDRVFPGDGDTGSAEGNLKTAKVLLPELFCRLYDGEMITMQSLSNGEYVSAANNGSSLVGVYLKTEPAVGNSEKFHVTCGSFYRLMWHRAGYGYGHVWAGGATPEYGTNEVSGGVYVGPNGNMSDNDTLAWYRDALEDLWLRDSMSDALSDPTGIGNGPVFDGETRAWTFISQGDTGSWKVGNTYITFDDDGVIEDDNLFEIDVTTGW